jgi:hypothetical protein
MTVPAEVQDACDRFRQGDIFENALISWTADLRTPLTPGAKRMAKALEAEGSDLGLEVVGEEVPRAIITSQTCDVRSPARKTVRIAPVHEIDDPAQAKSDGHRKQLQDQIDTISSGRAVHKIWLEAPAGNLYVDLEGTCTIEKSHLIGKQAIPGYSTTEQFREFAFRCGHTYDRPAVPSPVDTVVLASLRKFLIDLKATDSTNFATLNKAVEEEMLFLDDWDTPSVARLHFLDDDPIPDEARQLLEDWHQSVDKTALGTVSLLPNSYDMFTTLSADTYRDLAKISHWYLSEEEV